VLTIATTYGYPKTSQSSHHVASPETLLWLCKIKSPIGEERELCDRVTERLQRVSLAAPIRRYGESIVVPLIRGNGGPHVALAGHLDVVRTEHEGEPRIEATSCTVPARRT